MQRIVVIAVAIDRYDVIAVIVAAGINIATFNGVVFVKFVASKVKAEAPLFVDVLQFRHAATVCYSKDIFRVLSIVESFGLLFGKQNLRPATFQN